MTVYPRHRDLFGTRWRCNRSRCTVPAEMAAHKYSVPKPQCGLKTAHSAYVLQTTKMLVPVVVVSQRTKLERVGFDHCYVIDQKRVRVFHQGFQTPRKR